MTTTTTAYGLEEFCRDCHDALKKDPGNGGREAIRDRMVVLIRNKAFVAEHFGPEKPFGTTTLYRDPDTDFRVLAHCFTNGSKSPPHDHGKSWAIYGQTKHHTDMIVWNRLDDGSDNSKVKLEVGEEYRLGEGDVGIFHPGDIHSIDFPDGARFLRVTGTDLDQEAQAIYNLKNNSVKIGSAATAIDSESEARGKK
jgi:predicted metal-dependent enzyme (double-stranded beta helix superfamily)